MSNSGLVGPGGAPLDTAGAKPVLGDDQLRAKQAAEEIRVILDAYDAELFPVMMLSPKGIIGVSVDVLPKSRLNAGQIAAVTAEKESLEGQAEVDALIEKEGDSADSDIEEEPDKA